MQKRDLATVLWFLAGWSGGGLLVGIMGLPSLLAFVPGILIAGLVRWDPAHLLWSQSSQPRRSQPRRIVRPINEVADELDRRAALGQGAEGDRAHR